MMKNMTTAKPKNIAQRTGPEKLPSMVPTNASTAEQTQRTATALL